MLETTLLIMLIHFLTLTVCSRDAAPSCAPISNVTRMWPAVKNTGFAQRYWQRHCDDLLQEYKQRHSDKTILLIRLGRDIVQVNLQYIGLYQQRDRGPIWITATTNLQTCYKTPLKADRRKSTQKEGIRIN